MVGSTENGRFIARYINNEIVMFKIQFYSSQKTEMYLVEDKLNYLMIKFEYSPYHPL